MHVFSDGGYFASTSDPPAVSFYPSQRPGQNSQSHIPPNPWEREEREKVNKFKEHIYNFFLLPPFITV